jgi:hypothetical protein
MTDTNMLELNPAATEAEVLIGATEELAILVSPDTAFDMSFDPSGDSPVVIAHIEGRNRLITTAPSADGFALLSHIANLPDDARGIFRIERKVVIAEVDTLHSQVRDIGAGRSVPLRWNGAQPI